MEAIEAMKAITKRIIIPIITSNYLVDQVRLHLREGMRVLETDHLMIQAIGFQVGIGLEF